MEQFAPRYRALIRERDRQRRILAEHAGDVALPGAVGVGQSYARLGWKRAVLVVTRVAQEVIPVGDGSAVDRGRRGPAGWCGAAQDREGEVCRLLSGGSGRGVPHTQHGHQSGYAVRPVITDEALLEQVMSGVVISREQAAMHEPNIVARQRGARKRFVHLAEKSGDVRVIHRWRAARALERIVARTDDGHLPPRRGEQEPGTGHASHRLVSGD